MTATLQTMAPQSVPALEVTALSKRFAGVPALKDIDLAVLPGHVHALLGHNGSGKSTLIKLVSGFHSPEPGGEIRVGGTRMHPGSAADSYRLGCRFVHQDLGLVEGLSVADNLYLGGGYPTRLGTIRGRALLLRADAELRAVGVSVDPERNLGELPAATRTGVAMARALRQDIRSPVGVLVLDEPSAALPGTERARLHDIVRAVAARGVGVLYVTHHLAEVFELADDVTVLRDGVKVLSVATGGLDRSALVRHLIGDDPPAPISDPGGPSGRRRPMLAVRELVTAGLQAVSFDVDQGEIVGLAGLSGSGREAVLPAVFGATARHGGEVTLESKSVRPSRPRSAMDSGVGYLPADRIASGACMSLSARENLTLADLAPFWRFPVFRARSESAATRSWFERMGVRPPGATERRFETFSGGNQQKILFAKWLRRRPRLLLLEEPTQGVDVGAKLALHRAVRQAAGQGMSVLVSSSDNEELAGLCHRVLVLSEGAIVADLRHDALSAGALTAAMVSADGRPA